MPDKYQYRRVQISWIIVRHLCGIIRHLFFPKWSGIFFWIVRHFLGSHTYFEGTKRGKNMVTGYVSRYLKKISICNIKVKNVIMRTIPLNQVELNNRSNIPRVCVGCSCYTELVWFLLFTFPTISRRIS